MIDAIVYLINHPQQRDENGVMRKLDPVAREVYAQVESVTRSEFFDGGRNGLKPEYRFTVFRAEWQGERECKYNDIAYSIYRTYHVPGTDYIELYAERKVGIVNG